MDMIHLYIYALLLDWWRRWRLSHVVAVNHNFQQPRERVRVRVMIRVPRESTLPVACLLFHWQHPPPSLSSYPRHQGFHGACLLLPVRLLGWSHRSFSSCPCSLPSFWAWGACWLALAPRNSSSSWSSWSGLLPLRLRTLAIFFFPYSWPDKEAKLVWALSCAA